MTPRELYAIERAKRPFINNVSQILVEAKEELRRQTRLYHILPTVARDENKQAFQQLPKRTRRNNYARHRDPETIRVVRTMAAKGKRQRDIAAALGISPQSVSVVCVVNGIQLQHRCKDCRAELSQHNARRCHDCRRRHSATLKAAYCRTYQPAYRARKRRKMQSGGRGA